MTVDFKKRVLEFQFILGEGSFGESGSNKVTVSGLRASVSILKAGGASLGGANCRIYGLPLSVMNQLSTLGMPIILARRNSIIISAGNEGEKLSQVFQGSIKDAYFDGEDQPNVAFTVTAYVGLFTAAKPVDPSSFQGTADVVNVLSSVCQKANLTLQNNGVSVQMTNTYLSGSAYDQIRTICKHANINYHLDTEATADSKGVLTIWPKNGSRAGDPIEVSAETGMRNYPTFTGQGVVVTTLFNPSILYGSQIQVKSTLKPASRTWTVYKLTYDLEAQVPNGRWFTEIEAADPKYLQVFK